MINLSIEDCERFVLPALNYDMAESKARQRNLAMLDDLIKIISNKECLALLNSKSTPKCIQDIPNAMCMLYNKYFGAINRTTNPATVLKKLRAEQLGLYTKIANFATRWNVSEQEVFDQIKSPNSFLRLQFVKEPGRQSLHQMENTDWLSKLPIIENVKALPISGNASLHIVNGRIFEGTMPKTVLNKTAVPKSIDAVFEYTFKDKCLTFFGTQKYTKCGGGAQDNQYHDVQEFHMHAKKMRDRDVCLLSITDGEYYQTREKATNFQLTKLEYLNSNIFKGTRNFATNSENLLKDTAEYIEEWLKDNFTEAEIAEEIKKLHTLVDAVYAAN